MGKQWARADHGGGWDVSIMLNNNKKNVFSRLMAEQRGSQKRTTLQGWKAVEAGNSKYSWTGLSKHRSREMRLTRQRGCMYMSTLLYQARAGVEADLAETIYNKWKHRECQAILSQLGAAARNSRSNNLSNLYDSLISISSIYCTLIQLQALACILR